MIHLIWIIPLIPLLGFLYLIIRPAYINTKADAITGVMTTGISAVLSVVLAGLYYFPGKGHAVLSVKLWEWFSFSDVKVDFGLYLDSVSLLFVLIITVVGFLIHVYSIGFMREDEGRTRFFAYMNLFIASMLILVLSGNFLFLYLGWEAVGLCSYLLIGFWYKNPANGYAARKAFVVTRIGDAIMIIGLFALVAHFKTLNIQEIMAGFSEKFSSGDKFPLMIGFLLLGGAIGKSAQLPFQVWLPDAMAGPAPVSALIHAATMVTAGVYLIVRSYVVFELAPIVQATIMFLGIITLLIAGMSALVQRDIKKILAYSTISQLGYMFLALGVSAYTASLFHFVTHAFFKSLLFLGAGSVILHLHHEHDIRKMGGLKDQLPVTYLSFLAGAASLAALPLLTAGFYSKDAILWQVWNTPHYGRLYSVLGLLGSFITALYAFRLVFTVFWGEKRHSLPRKKSFTLEIPLIILAVLSLTAGFVNLPENFGSHLQWLEQSFHNSLLVNNHQGNHSGEWLFQVISSIVVVLGIFLAYVTYVKRPGFKKNWEKRFWYQYLQRGWGFDDLYKHAIIRPFEWVARINKNDLFDGISKLSVAGSKKLHGYLNYIQNGKVRWYAMSIGVGIILSVVLILLSA